MNVSPGLNIHFIIKQNNLHFHVSNSPLPGHCEASTGQICLTVTFAAVELPAYQPV